MRALRRGLFSGSRIALRGGKKKKGAQAASTEPLSQDIVNIFKERKDPQILPSDMYPPWLFELLEASGHTFQDRQMQMFYGRFMPSPRESYSYYRSLQRLQVKMKNDEIIEKLEGDSDDGERDPTPYVGTKQHLQVEEEEQVEGAAVEGEGGEQQEEEAEAEEEGGAKKGKKK